MNVQIQAAEIARIAELLAPLCDDDDQLFTDMLHGESDLFEIVGRLHGQIASDEELLAGITERQAHLAERKRRLSDRVTATKAAIGKFLRAATLPKIELPEATYSVRDGKPKLEIASVEGIPSDYLRVKFEADKTLINADFGDAADLPNWLTRIPATDIVTKRDK